MAGGLVFDNVDNLFHRYVFAAHQRYGNVRTLVVRAVLRNFLRARAERGNGYQHFEAVAVSAAGHFAAEGNVVIQQRADARYGCGFLAEKRKRDSDFSRVGIQQLQHALGEVFQFAVIEFAAAVFHQGDEARHVRAFLFCGQADGHGEPGDGGLGAGGGGDLQGEAEVFDADLVNRHVA